MANQESTDYLVTSHIYRENFLIEFDANMEKQAAENPNYPAQAPPGAVPCAVPYTMQPGMQPPYPITDAPPTYGK